jgi:hypothetical protein
MYRLLLIPVLLGASACGAAQGVAGVSPAPPSATSAIKISLPPEPPRVLAALHALVRERDPQVVQRLDSVEVKYVTDRQFEDAISNAWKAKPGGGSPASCGTYSGPALNGHWYVVALHGKFVGASSHGLSTHYVSVLAGLVAAPDLHANVGGFTQVPIGADGQPLCWSLLPG